MARVQLALNVDDIEVATRFYRKLFGVEPAKRRPGYANFEIADPPLKLVLFENPGASSPLNHLGVEVASPAEVSTSPEFSNVTWFMPSCRCGMIATFAWQTVVIVSSLALSFAAAASKRS